jgi:hypothetical protein
MTPRQPKGRTCSLLESASSTFHITPHKASNWGEIWWNSKFLPLPSCSYSTGGLAAHSSMKSIYKPSSCSGIPPWAHTREGQCGKELANPAPRSHRRHHGYSMPNAN